MNVTDFNFFINEPIHVTTKEVTDAITSLKNNKACGNDLILNEFLKYGSVKLLPLFVKDFNIVFTSGIIQHLWSEGYISNL